MENKASVQISECPAHHHWRLERNLCFLAFVIVHEDEVHMILSARIYCHNSKQI